jgi:hypothetical protein
MMHVRWPAIIRKNNGMAEIQIAIGSGVSNPLKYTRKYYSKAHLE